MVEGSGNGLLSPYTGLVHIEGFTGPDQIGGLFKLERGVKRPFLSMNVALVGPFHKCIQMAAFHHLVQCMCT